jgi:outer membrane receptor protein involved in Fe transport
MGSCDRRDILGATNLVLTDDLTTRLTVASLKRDGYVDNKITGDDLRDKDSLAVRGAFLFEPSNDLGVLFNIAYIKTRTNGSTTVATTTNLTPNGGIWQASFSPVELAENEARYGINQANVPTDDLFESDSAEKTFSKRESIGANLVFNYALNDRFPTNRPLRIVKWILTFSTTWMRFRRS